MKILSPRYALQTGIFALLAATVSLSAHANQATSSIHGAVTCESMDGGFKVTISANRKTLTIVKKNRAPEVYAVDETVGDVSTWYAPNSGNPSLNFADQGDFLQFRASERGVALACPQGR